LSALKVPEVVELGRQVLAALAVVFQQLSLASQAQSSADDGPPLPDEQLADSVPSTKATPPIHVDDALRMPTPYPANRGRDKKPR
jgi:hypothetical protein